jgi:hypothetical protein
MALLPYNRPLVFALAATVLMFSAVLVPQQAGMATAVVIDVDVTDIESGRPLADAEVTVRVAAGIHRLMGRTDRSGRIRVELNVAGRTEIGASKPGYGPLLVHSEPGPDWSWAADLRDGDSIVAYIGLAPTLRLEGFVIDPTGTPSEGTLVDAILVRGFVQGGLPLRPRVLAEAKVDKQGRFRFDSLPQGEYLIRAWPTAAAMTLTHAGSGGGIKTASVVTYYPAATVAAAADEIRLMPSDETPNINITMRRLPAENYRIPFQSTARLRADTALIPLDDIRVHCPYSRHPVTRPGRAVGANSHDFFAVPDGLYRLAARAFREDEPDPVWHLSEVLLSSGASTHPIVFLPSAQVSGAVQLTGAVEMPKALKLSPSDPWDALVADRVVSVRQDGTFYLTGLNPGTHEVRIGSEWTAAHPLIVRKGSTQQESLLTVAAGDDLDSVVVELGPEVSIDGLLTHAASGLPPAQSYAVILINSSADPRGILASARRTRSDRTGRFVFHSVPPGAYRVAVVDVNDIHQFSRDGVLGINQPPVNVDVKSGVNSLTIKVAT